MTVIDESDKTDDVSSEQDAERPAATDTERPGPPDDAARDSDGPKPPRVPAWLADPEATVNLTGEVSFSTVRDDEATVSVRGDLSDIPVRDDDATVNIAGDIHFPRVRDDFAETGEVVLHDEAEALADAEAHEAVALRAVPDTLPPGAEGSGAEEISRQHLRGVLEALVFAADKPISLNELAKSANADKKDVRVALADLKADYAPRGIQLEEIAGGWIFRTNPAYAPFVRDLTGQKPVKLSRAQLETLSILAYRQPITRPEIDEIRGVDCGPVLKVLLERDLIRILGKKDEPGRPLLYGTTPYFLEFFGLRSLKDLPTLKEFAELTDESRRVVERELGEVLPEVGTVEVEAVATIPPPEEGHATDPPDAMDEGAHASEEGTAPEDGADESSVEGTPAARPSDQPEL